MQYYIYTFLFVFDEDLKGGIKGYTLCLLANQLKLQLYMFGCNHARASITSDL